MLSRRALVFGSASIAAANAMLLRAAWADTPPRWTRDEKDPRWVHGEVVAPSSPEVTWRHLARVPEWPRLFTDIKSLRVVEHAGDAWKLKVASRTFDYGAYDYEARIDPATRTAKGWLGTAGVSAICTMRVLDGSAPSTSRVSCSLFIDARGVAAWAIGKDELRRRQEHMVVQYLADLQRGPGSPRT